MADAYGTLANGGSHIPATIINKVVFPDKSVANFGGPPRTRVFPDGEAYEATSVLKQVITSGTGTAANYGCPAAGKTGTANNLENAWFVGYTPRMSTAVWVGYPQGNVPMSDGFGGTLAAPIWHDYMQAASGDYCGQFPQPTVPFVGTPYFGPRSVTGRLSTIPGQNGSGTGGTTTSTTNPYDNPTLYAQPPQPAPPNAGSPNAGTPKGTSKGTSKGGTPSGGPKSGGSTPGGRTGGKKH
jgi:penicillin-binding protein 1A